MAYQIRSLSFAENLDRSLRVLIDNALVLIGVSAVVAPLSHTQQGTGREWASAGPAN